MGQNPNQTARRTVEEALGRLSAELEAGRRETFMAYLTALSRLRGHTWSNVLLIVAQRPNATDVRSMHGWNDIGRRVKKGEKGLLTLATSTEYQRTFPNQPPHQAGPFPPVSGRATYTFDVSQTDGKPLSALVRRLPDPRDLHQALKSFAGSRGITLRDAWSPANGPDPRGESHVGLPLAADREFSMILRKVVVELLHRGKAAALDRQVLDAQAYAVTHVVTCNLGLISPDVPAECLVGGQNPHGTLAQSLATIQETAAQLLDELRPEERVCGDKIQFQRERPLLDAEEFGRLHRDYRDRLIENMHGLVRDRDKAEDIAARAFETAWEKRESFRGESRPSTWLEAIARNEARHSWRQERTSRSDSLDQTEARELAAPERVTDASEKEDDRLRLHKALDQLPPWYRRALVAHFVEGLSIRDIAGREHVPFGTVLSRVHMGKRLLRQAWERCATMPSTVTATHASVPLASERKTERALDSPHPQEGGRSETKAHPPTTWER